MQELKSGKELVFNDGNAYQPYIVKFYDKQGTYIESKWQNFSDAVNHALKMINNGAEVLLNR